VTENLTVASWGALASWLGILRRRTLAARYEHWRTRLAIRATGNATQLIDTLSGGNQQKVVLGRWLENKSAILVLAEPTRGVDVGARAEIYEVLKTLAEEGIAILIISTDAEEVLRICDRIVVMSDGRVTDVIPGHLATMARLAASAAAMT
jgi:ABC-type sugar transport system ATPase subunit